MQISCPSLRYTQYSGPTKSRIRSIYFELINFVKSKYSSDLKDDLRLSIAKESFKFSFKSFCYNTTIGLDYLTEIAVSAFNEEIISTKRDTLFIYGPELMMHLSQDHFSAGKYHTDCSNDILNYYTVWSPLFNSNYSQLSFKHDNQVFPSYISSNHMIIFPGYLIHKGNYNYSSKDHCGLVVRITVNEPAHPGNPLIAKLINGNVQINSSHRDYLKTNLNILKILYTVMYDFLNAYVQADPTQRQQLIFNFVKQLPNKPEMRNWYKLYFTYSYVSDYLESIGICPIPLKMIPEIIE